MPFHYTKSFGLFARDYGMQEGFGLPDLYEGVVPVAVIDDKTEYVAPTYPVYTARGQQAAVAAIYSLVGLFVPPGGNPIRLTSVFGEGTNSTVWSFTIATKITANAGTFTPAGLVRGSTLTTQGLTGTTTVAPLTLDENVILWATNDTQLHAAGLLGLILRPGEYLWISSIAVNDLITADFQFEELTFPLPGNPSAL